FEAYRPLMFSIAYRMLGSVTEAEDIVQEAYLRYQATPTDQIVSHKAFLSTIVTRLCLNQLQSARAQREAYIRRTICARERATCPYRFLVGGSRRQWRASPDRARRRRGAPRAIHRRGGGLGLRDPGDWQPRQAARAESGTACCGKRTEK